MTFLSQCTSGGCGAKIEPNAVAAFLQQLPQMKDQHLLVGYDAADDAAVYQISDDTALISTVDFFSPMVEDPRTFGRIACANALSDVYAMGGKVLYALNLVCFPQKLDKEFLAEILHGGSEKLKEAGAVLAGGHSIYDHEPKYGLAVTGQITPEKIIRNDTPQTGDILILTKALGVGLIQSAVRGELVSPEAEKAAICSMERLNKYAAEKMLNFPVHACTDVTGFGLAVHASEMAGKKHTIVLAVDQLPLLPNAYQYAAEYLATAAGQRNRQAMQGKIDLSGVDTAMQELLFDPQTSGGLLLSVAPEKAADCLAAIKADDPAAAIIGEVCQREEQAVLIV
ncbi:selenide, water dikinase SelD [Erwinia sp. CPCC 100877]|nr:selenide, water dikinase SelD [Erwinia sp. CPCC 100877]